MAKLKQLKCPSCGAGLSLHSPCQVVVDCPYCHSQVINENAYQSKDNSVEPTILPFSWTEEKVMKAFSDHLVGLEDTPSDVFVKMQITSIKKYYVPMYIFQGSYRAPWTAKVPRFQKRVGVNDKGVLEEKRDIVYDYVNGEAVGNFIFNSIPEKEAQNIGIDLSFLQNVNINTSKCIPLSSLNLKQEDNIEYLSPSGNADDVWNESAQEMAQNEAYAAAMNQCPQSEYSDYPSLFRGYMEMRGYRVDIVSCSASCEMKKATLVYIPVWRINYKYQNSECYFIFYAEQDEKWTSVYPKDTTTIQANATEEQQTLLDSYKNEVAPAEKFTSWGCGLLAVAEILTIFGITSLFESLREANFGWYFPLAGLIVAITYFVIDYKKKKEFGIDEINAEIANRTAKMAQISKDYKKKTCERFLQSKAWENDMPLNASDLTSAFVSSFASLQTPDDSNGPSQPASPLYDSSTSNGTQSNSNTKYCKQCGKIIDAGHTFCRYCGTKQ